MSEFIFSTRFDVETEKHIDVSQWFTGPVFEPLKDPKFFKKFFIEAGTLANLYSKPDCVSPGSCETLIPFYKETFSNKIIIGEKIYGQNF